MTRMHQAATEPAPPSAVSTSRVVFGGIDTHKELHVAAVVDFGEVVLGTASFSTTRAGYRALIRWLRSFGDVRRVGVEGTGSYGAGLTRHLTEAGVEVLEVDRPDRSDRRRKGKDGLRLRTCWESVRRASVTGAAGVITVRCAIFLPGPLSLGSDR